MFLYVFEYIFLCSCTQLKKIENWLPPYCSHFFQNSPCAPQLHRDPTAQPSSAPVSSPSTCLGLGRSHQPPWVPAHVPCLLCVQMDLLLHGQRKEELQDVTAGNVSPTHNMPQPKLQTLTRLISHPWQLNMYIKLLPCMRRGLGS